MVNQAPKHGLNSNIIYDIQNQLKEKISKAGEYNLKFVHEINKGCRDSIINPNLVKINGIESKMELDTFNGCVPLAVKPKVTITENFHFTNASNSVKYRWSVSPSVNVVIIKDAPSFTINSLAFLNKSMRQSMQGFICEP